MKKIYIITTYTGTVLSYLIRNISKTPYAHVSIALNQELNPMYSFGRLNPKTPIFAGFVEENINEGLYAIRTNTMCRVYSLEVTELQYERLYENIMVVSNSRKSYDYDIMALIYLSINKPREADYKYVCSHFVADMLKKSGLNIFDKEPCAIRPNDFYDLAHLTLEYEGLLSKYNALEHSYIPIVAEI
ncbi:hypothetical protein CHF27_012105 [Romboutsia maritimum]|uniref:Permuted papain-like amidase enzyme, YaeF/YiiX, C92 family n=1 Tax=Romboutsia maritimum TaxID=2020948 RepID=A0A371IQD2_9FIRM|nr:hypothetical protein [Romboutsia maritimum]RDY22681.1 hypothetical protein CHF27_012105 [Romboutsia maritimum]